MCSYYIFFYKSYFLSFLFYFIVLSFSPFVFFGLDSICSFIILSSLIKYNPLLLFFFSVYLILSYPLLSYLILYEIGTAPPGRTRKHWFAAPYPSSFHYHEGIKELPWDLPGSSPPIVNNPLQSGSRLLSAPYGVENKIGYRGNDKDKDNDNDRTWTRNMSINAIKDNNINASKELDKKQSTSISGYRNLLSNNIVTTTSSSSSSSGINGDRTRDILSLFIGSIKTAQASSRALRTALFNQVAHPILFLYIL